MQAKGIQTLLSEISDIIKSGLDEKKTSAILYLMGCPVPSEPLLAELRLNSEYFPIANEYPFTQEQRYLHFLWDAADRSPLTLAANFSLPLRRMIAKKLFRRCGKNFCCENGVRFNFGQFLEVGDNVFINAGTFLDSKGGITIGNYVGIGEYVRILTHTHSESDHTERTYGRVIIGDYAKLYLGATIFHGLTIGEQAIVAAGSVVTKDVPANHVVAGIPAEVIRERHTQGRHREQLNHHWLFRAAFQDD
ncbi:MAG: putative acyl transferase [Methanoregula sp. PtaU1.Bin051]|nr:MAG: putative acyl transferase [Methanoregula sp. PtaU1.Bin051]